MVKIIMEVIVMLGFLFINDIVYLFIFFMMFIFSFMIFGIDVGDFCEFCNFNGVCF